MNGVVNMEKDDFELRFFYIFKAPLVFPPSGVKSGKDLADRHSDEIMIHRLADVDWENKRASEYEAMLYIAVASFDGPLDNDYFHIYMHLFKKFYPEEADKVSDDEHDFTINDYQRELLNRLREHIFDAQIKEVKKYLRENNNSKENAQIPIREEENGIVTEI